MSWAFSLYCSGSVAGLAAAVALAADSHGRVRPWSGGGLAWVALAIAAIADVAASILLIISVVKLTGSVTLSSRTVRRSTILIIPVRRQQGSHTPSTRGADQSFVVRSHTGVDYDCVYSYRLGQRARPCRGKNAKNR